MSLAAYGDRRRSDARTLTRRSETSLKTYETLHVQFDFLRAASVTVGAGGGPLLAPVGHGGQYLLETRMVPDARQKRIPAQPVFPVITHTHRPVQPLQRLGRLAPHRIKL